MINRQPCKSCMEKKETRMGASCVMDGCLVMTVSVVGVVVVVVVIVFREKKR